MGTSTLLPDPTCLHLNLLDASETAITAVVTTTTEEAVCSLCHHCSTRIHSRYVRAVADLPWMGTALEGNEPLIFLECVWIDSLNQPIRLS